MFFDKRKNEDGAPRLDPTVRAYVNSSRLAENYDEYFSGTPLFEFDCEYLESALGLPRPPEEGFTILDLGCGTGRHLELAAMNGCRAVGVDLNPHMLAKAKQRLTRAGVAFSEWPAPGGPEPARLVAADINAPPLAPGERFDAAIMMFSTFGLVIGEDERRRFLSRLARRLKPRGKLVIHVHNELRARKLTPALSRENLDEIRLRAVGKLDPGDHLQKNYRGVLDLRLHYFTPEELRELVADSGFRILDFLYLNQRRDGSYSGPDRETMANGFLVTAEVLS